MHLFKGGSFSTDKDASIVLDLNSLTQYSDKCSVSPKMTAITCSQFDELKQAETVNKALWQAAANMSSLSDSNDGRNKRFNRLRTIRPRSILLLFATLSVVGTILLVYFTLAINLREV